MISPSYPSAWENKLIDLAQEAHEQVWHGHDRPAAGGQDNPILSASLRSAYAQCEAVTSQYSRSFHMATALLPTPKRKAVRALYAFCRTADNLADDGHAHATAALQEWRERSLAEQPDPEDGIALAWSDTRQRYNIPLRYAEQLIEGVQRDLDFVRYPTFEDLSLYCYQVASTVGLMSMHIIGCAGRHMRPQAVPYAIKLGVALQMTNILRDVGEDWRSGRLYLPQEELADYGLSEADVEAGQVTHRWRDFMRFQIARAHQLYTEAWPGIGMLDRDGHFAVTAAAMLYQGILDDIEANDYNVFDRRAHVSDWKKLGQLIPIYRKSLSFRNQELY